MTFHIEYPRTVPARRPEDHEPRAPRYTLRWRRPVNRVVSVYFGIQGRELPWTEQKHFFKHLRNAFASECGPETHEIMRCRDEAGYTNAIVVAYWTDPNKYEIWQQSSPFADWFRSESAMAGPWGYWWETIDVHYDRMETIYSEGDYRIGLGRCPGTEIISMTTNGYFGAARDRFPVSAVDELPGVPLLKKRSSDDLVTHGRRIIASVPHNLTAIRSGQYWEGASGEQLDDYEDVLQAKLLEGMAYLVENQESSGTLCLRMMTNLDEDGRERRETSVNAYFSSLSAMEEWAASHPTHLKIYHHAIAKNREYGASRQVVTWHEVFLLTGGLPFEYVNCHPETGVLSWCPLYERVD